jgi:diaminohydroxyphosphoribosylaminopyrimidine deaminase / 5-amino-6-(5-phosphoribosylamino)uracil reductase
MSASVSLERPQVSRLHVTLKLATSLDGRIATASGDSKWITGGEARAEAHRLRAAHDAVLVGSGTVLADDPELTARTDPPPARQPLRIVADARGRTPLGAKLFQTLDKAPLAIAVGSVAAGEKFTAVQSSAFEVWGVIDASWKGPGVSPSLLLQTARQRGLATVMVEGGGQLAASFVKAGFVDRIEWFRAPILLGGDGLPALGALALENVVDVPTFVRTRVQEVGADLWESYELRNV